MITIILSVLLAIPQQPGESAAAAPIVDFLRLPTAACGDSIATMTAKLGPPVATRFEFVPSVHEPTIRNVRAKLVFRHVQATLIIVLCCNKSVLETIRVDRAAGESVLGQVLPARAVDVENRLGRPTLRSPTKMVYKIENEVVTDTVTFWLDRAVVTHIEWRYFVD